MRQLASRRSMLWAKQLLFPGLDLHTRCRYRFLPRFFKPGSIDTLDAGCGNGALAYAAFKLGNRVLGVTDEPEQARKANTFFSALGVPPERLSFEVCNLYNLGRLSRKFDQIICSETLEHIKQDHLVVKSFYELLRPGGVLHLCSPFALHPDHHLGRVDNPEDGGHVRDGYTIASYKSLLEPAGFQIVRSIGLGSPILVRADSLARLVGARAGSIAALPAFLLTWPLQWADFLNPAVPFSLYVEAVKVSLGAF